MSDLPSQPQPTPSSAPAPARSPLAKFPASVRAAHERFLATKNASDLDTVVIAIVLDHQPSHAKASGEITAPDTARLIADLGFDSLALAEIVFFLEDLYRVTITNEELMKITTVGELRAFVRTKVADTGAA